MSVWTRPAVEKLIRLYRDHPCLYNSRMREYKDQTVKGRAWEFIKNNLQDVRSGITAEQVKNKVNNLRGQYSAEYAKLRYNRNYEPKIWFFNDLEFLKEFTRNASGDRSSPTPSRMSDAYDDSSRESNVSRNSVSSSTSFLDSLSISRDSPIGRMRTGLVSPAPSLYGEEAEPFLGDAARGQSFESSIPTSSNNATANMLNSSIFDQPTIGSVQVPNFSSPDISPVVNRNNLPGNNGTNISSPERSPFVRPTSRPASVFRIPTSTPMVQQIQRASSAPILNNTMEIPSQIVMDDAFRNSYEIIYVSDNDTSVVQESPNIKRELSLEMYTQTEEMVGSQQPGPLVERKEIETQTDEVVMSEMFVQTEVEERRVSEICTQTDEVLSENQPEEIVKRVSEIYTQTDEVLSENQPQEIVKRVSEICTQTDEILSESQPEEIVKVAVSEIVTQTAENLGEEREMDVEQPEPFNSGREAVKEICTQTENTVEEPKPGCSHWKDELPAEKSTQSPGTQPGPSRLIIEVHTITENAPNRKRKLSVKRKIPTISDSDNEYWSGEECGTCDECVQALPPPAKKAKVVAVTSSTVLPNYFKPIRDWDETDAFGTYIAIKLRNLPEEEREDAEVKLVSAFRRNSLQ